MRYHLKINTVTGETTMTPLKARTDAELRAEMQQIVDDCPECQELRARGEVPIVRGPFPGPRERARKKRRR